MHVQHFPLIDRAVALLTITSEDDTYQISNLMQVNVLLTDKPDACFTLNTTQQINYELNLTILTN